jgi:hypothetical protein
MKNLVGYQPVVGDSLGELSGIRNLANARIDEETAHINPESKRQVLACEYSFKNRPDHFAAIFSTG